MTKDLKETYFRAARRCKTRNQLAQLQFRLESRLTPREAICLAHELPRIPSVADFRRNELNTAIRSSYLRLGVAPPTEKLKAWTFAVDSAHWGVRLADFHEKTGKESVWQHTRHRLSPNLIFFRSPGQRKNKRLVIGFTTTGRLMLPPWAFLLFLPEGTDLAIINDRRDRGFRHGLMGLGTDFFDWLDALASLLEIEQYSFSAAVGSSAGGLPAIFAGFRLKCNSVLGLSSQGLNNPKWSDVNPQALLELLASRASSPPTIFLAYDSGYDPDKESADSISRSIRAEPCPIPSEGIPRHNPLWPLFLRGELSDFLASTIFRGLSRSNDRE